MHCSTGQGKTAAPLFSAALQTRLTACLCHCNYTYRDLLSTQVCIYAPMHCSNGQGNIASLLFSAALQNRLTACLCHCKYIHGDLLNIQVCTDATAKQCSTGQGRIASLLSSAALQNRLTACLCHCKYLYGDLISTQVCSDATPKHCSTDQGRIPPYVVQCCSAKQAHSMLVPLLKTYGDLLFVQVCIDATQKHCSTGQGRIASLLSSAARQTQCWRDSGQVQRQPVGKSCLHCVMYAPANVASPLIQAAIGVAESCCSRHCIQTQHRQVPRPHLSRCTDVGLLVLLSGNTDRCKCAAVPGSRRLDCDQQAQLHLYSA